MKTKTQRVLENNERLEDWRSKSPIEQLLSLDRRLGKGVGAVKQRAKLLALLATPVVVPDPLPVVSDTPAPAKKKFKKGTK